MTSSASRAATYATTPSLPTDGRARLVDYALHLESKTRIDMNALMSGHDTANPGLVRDIELTIDGTLERLLLDDDDDGTIELVRVRDATAQYRNRPDSSSDRASSEALVAALQTGVVLHRTAAGAVERIRLPRAVAAVADSALRQLAEQLQVGASPSASTWAAVEGSVYGALRVAYHRGDQGRLTRRIDAVELRSPEAAPGVAIRPSIAGDYTITTGDDLFDVIEGTATSSMTIEGGARAVSTDEVRVGVRRTGARVDAAALAAARAGLDEWFGPWGDLDAPPTADASADDDLIAGRDLDSILGDIQTALARGETSPRDAAALFAYVRTRAGAAAALARTIAAGADLQDRGVQLRIAALAHAGHDQAQAALVELTRARRDRPADAQALLAALTLVESPSEATEGFLRELGRGEGPVATSARLGMGTVARRVTSSDPARADAIVDELVAALEPAGADLPSRLAAVANTRSPRILEPASAALVHPDPYVREMAAGAIASVDGDQAERLLAQRIAAEGDGATLTAIVRITERRPPSRIIVDALIARLHAGVDPAVALALIDGIARGQAVAPGARVALEHAASQTGEVGDRARRHLGA